MIAILGLTQIFAWGSTYYLLAVLAKPIVAATGWSQTGVVGGISIGLLAGGLASPQVGRMIEKHGGRPVLAASAVLLAAGLVALGSAQNLPSYLMAWLVMGLGMGAGLYDPAFATLGRLYGVDARRAITTLTLVAGFASTICWPLSSSLVAAVGWRGACFVYAAIQLGFSLPLYLFAMPREAPRTDRGARANGADPGPGAPTRRWWMIGLVATIVTVGAILSTLMSVHLLSILQSRGATTTEAVALGALIGPSQVGARFVETLIARRHHPIWTKVTSVACVTSGLLALWSGLPILPLALMVYGAGAGLESIARGTLPLALFGAQGYAALMGKLALPSLAAQAAAPSIGALLIDRLGVTRTLGALAAVGLANLLLVACLVLSTRGARKPNRAGGSQEP